MEQQKNHRDNADLASAARERLNYLQAQGSRRLSRRSVRRDQSSNIRRPDFEPVVSSPLRQHSWSQEAVRTPARSPVPPDSFDDGPILDQGYDEEPVVLHPAGLERVSPEVWASWYIQEGHEETSSSDVTETPVASLRMLSQSSDPDYTNTSFPFFSPQQPIGSPSPSRRSIATSELHTPPLNFSRADPPRPASPGTTTATSILQHAAGSSEQYRSLG
ncbi:hypothetical protein NOR_01394 [Metarhizium rileyi]|uniref:Uncharacterized protein n=1 Tax=Metarhizium rileyi (strain RCEF 4871) TaxID=1649241 RepID=A0A167IV22_METRR|nr:hypothetical protein NOR_01394 [Metarhizium rileyi RCEF 4871]